MTDFEHWAVIASGVVGLASFAGGSLLAATPPLDTDLSRVVATLERRRPLILAGSVLSAAGAALLLWPVAAVSTSGSGDAWPSLTLFSIAVAILGFGFVTVSAVLLAALAWRAPEEVPDPVIGLVLAASHLAVWSVSARSVRSSSSPPPRWGSRTTSSVPSSWWQQSPRS